MKMQIQPNRASCVATSFAMVIDIPVEKMFKVLGHDGTEKMFPNKHIPFRGFHPQECMWFAHRLGVDFATYEFESVGGWDEKDHYKIMIPWDWSLILESDGVLQGHTKMGLPHAVAWCGGEQRIYDPNGTIYTKDYFLPDYFFKMIL